MKTQTIRKKIEFETCGNCYTCEVDFKLYYDPSYGADADGNRGVGMWFVDDYEIVDDAVYNCESGKLVKKRGKAVQAALEKAIEVADV